MAQIPQKPYLLYGPEREVDRGETERECVADDLKTKLTIAGRGTREFERFYSFLF